MNSLGSHNKSDKNSLTQKVKINTIDHKARGITSVLTHRGEKIYKIPHSFPGEIVELLGRKSKRQQKKSVGKVNKILKSPWKKIVPFCSVYHICGGCTMQELSYTDQLKIKEQMLDMLLKEFCESGQEHTRLEIIPSQKKFYYRNRIDFSFGAHRWLEEEEGDVSDKRALGLHVSGYFDKVVKIPNCYLHASNTIRKELHNWCIENSLEYFNARDKKGLLRTLTIRNNLAGEMMLILTVTERNNKVLRLIDYIINRFAEIKSLYTSVNAAQHDSLLMGELIHEKGDECITEQCGNIKLLIHPRVFYQSNSIMTPILYQTLINIANFKASDKVLDLYCGVGSIGLFIAPNVDWVYGLEMEHASVIRAVENAKINNIENISFKKAMVEDELLHIFKNESHIDVCILDPPRAGLHPKVINALLDFAPNKIMYMSCNPTSLARDIKLLVSKYSIYTWQSIDMFPHTHHVETIVRLDKK